MNPWRPAHTLVIRVGPLSMLPGAAGLRRTVTQRVTDRVAVLAHELGLPLAPHLELVLDELPGVEVSSDGQAVPARALDLEEAWRLIAPAEDEPVPFGWEWQRWASVVRRHADGQEMVAALVAEVVAGLLQRRPERLFTVRQAVAYLMRHGEMKARDLDPEALLRTAAPALAHGLGIGDGPRVLDHLAGDHLPQRDRVEALIADLRAERVEARVSADLAREPLGPSVAAGLPLVADHLLDELGLRIPPVRLVPDERMAPGCLTVRINSMTGRLHRGLPAGTLMVDAAPDELGGRFGTARPVRNPATGERCSVVNEGFAGALRAAGRMTWTQLDHVLLTIAAEIRDRAAALVDIRTVEYELALVHRDAPDLVLESLDVLSLADLTQVARDLVRDGPGIRDLRLVLERLVAFDVLTGAADRAFLDDPHVWQTSGMGGTPAPVEERTQYVRTGMGERLAHRYADGHADGHARIPALVVGHDVVERLRQHRDHDRNPTAGRALPWAELRPLVDAVHHTQLRSAEARTPVLLTVGDVRGRLASLLVEAVPNVAVLAFEELPWGTEVASLGRLSLAGLEPAAGGEATRP